MLHAALTVGFEMEFYSFSEPLGSLSQQAEQVCVVVSGGTIGATLTVVPIWLEDTANGELLCV